MASNSFDFGSLGNMGSLGSSFSMDAFSRMNPLDKTARRHMSKVYGTLLAGVFLTAVGVWIYHNMFALPLLVSGLASIGCLLYVNSTGHGSDSKQITAQGRLLAAGAFFVLKGMTIADLVLMASLTGVLPMAFFTTVAVFGCFSMAAMWAEKRQFLFLGGILGSVLFYMSLAGLFNMFFRSSLLFDAQLYLGLAVFMGYIVYDTQVVLLQVEQGQRDFVKHALNLYVDLIAVFVRLVIILMKQQEKRRADKDRRRR
eukprot:GDKH01006313.1.p1 GENE.GDKH01006313.1~~GDKH01006313.1.p1  ORF type:complete len:256 (+),score=38.02 GDKH01006313.1:116-883(+)